MCQPARLGAEFDFGIWRLLFDNYLARWYPVAFAFQWLPRDREKGLDMTENQWLFGVEIAEQLGVATP